MNAPRGSFDDIVIALALADSFRNNYARPAGSSVVFDGELWSGADDWLGYDARTEYMQR